MGSRLRGTSLGNWAGMAIVDVYVIFMILTIVVNMNEKGQRLKTDNL